MSKMLISETTLKNLIQQVLKEVLNEGMFDNMQKLKPGDKSIADRMADERRVKQFEKEKEETQAAAIKCLQKFPEISVEDAYTYYNRSSMSLPSESHKVFVNNLESSKERKMYLKGMMYAYTLGEVEAAGWSWLVRVAKLLDSECVPT